MKYRNCSEGRIAIKGTDVSVIHADPGEVIEIDDKLVGAYKSDLDSQSKNLILYVAVVKQEEKKEEEPEIVAPSVPQEEEIKVVRTADKKKRR